MGCTFWDKSPGDAMASAEVDDLVTSAGFDEKLVHSSDFLGCFNEVRPMIREDLLRFA